MVGVFGGGFEMHFTDSGHLWLETCGKSTTSHEDAYDSELLVRE